MGDSCMSERLIETFGPIPRGGALFFRMRCAHRELRSATATYGQEEGYCGGSVEKAWPFPHVNAPTEFGMVQGSHVWPGPSHALALGNLDGCRGRGLKRGSRIFPQILHQPLKFRIVPKQA